MRRRWSATAPTPTGPVYRGRGFRTGNPGRTDGPADWRSGTPSRARPSRPPDRPSTCPPASWHSERESPHEGDLQRRAERRGDGRIEADLAQELSLRLGSQGEYGRPGRVRGPQLQQIRHLDLDRIGRARVDNGRVADSRGDRGFGTEVGEHRARLDHKRVGGRPPRGGGGHEEEPAADDL